MMNEQLRRNAEAIARDRLRDRSRYEQFILGHALTEDDVPQAIEETMSNDQTPFQVGDRVKRVAGEDGNMYESEEGVVKVVYPTLSGYKYDIDVNDGCHAPQIPQSHLVRVGSSQTNISSPVNENTTMSKRFYQVQKDTFLWGKGAVLSRNEDGSYSPINEIFNKHEDVNQTISGEIVENSPEFFERVYEVNLLNKVIFKTKELAREFMAKDYTEPTSSDPTE